VEDLAVAGVAVDVDDLDANATGAAVVAERRWLHRRHTGWLRHDINHVGVLLGPRSGDSHDLPVWERCGLGGIRE
jgi:hypothetical protein